MFQITTKREPTDWYYDGESNIWSVCKMWPDGFERSLWFDTLERFGFGFRSWILEPCDYGFLLSSRRVRVVCVCVFSISQVKKHKKKKNRYKGKRLVHRCSGLILENFTKVSEVGGTNEEWGTVVEFVITELKRRLSHSECVIQRPPPPPPVVVLECELPARAVSVSCT